MGVLQHGFRAREPRVKVLLPARMKIGEAWVDAMIHNVSSRGLLVASDHPPRPGAYVDIRRGANILIGRVVWRKDRFFGVHTQDRVDLPSLQKPPERPAGRGTAGTAGNDTERRSAERLQRDTATARKLERNRERSRILQFAVIGSVSAAACAGVALGVYNVLHAPLARIEKAMTLGATDQPANR